MSEEAHNTAVTQPQTVQPTSTVKTPDQVKPQTVQPTKTVTDPKQAPAPVKPEPVKPQPTQTTEQATSAKQPTVSAKAAEPVKPQAVQPTVQATEPIKPQPTVPTTPAPVKTPEPVKPQTVQPTKTVQEPVNPQTTQSTETVTNPKQPTVPPVKAPELVKPQPTQPAGTVVNTEQPTEVPKLSDVVPTSKVWISGLIGNRQIDCLGPIEIPLKIDKPTYPFTPVPANSDYTNQVFNYDTGEWIATDAKSQGQMLTDLTKKVSSLQESSGKYDQTAGQSQKISLLFTQNLIQLTNKMDVIEHKLDNLLNSKDSDK